MSGGFSNAGSKSKGASGRDPVGLAQQFTNQFLELGLGGLLESIGRKGEFNKNPFTNNIVSGQEDLLKKLGGLSGQLDNLPDQLKRTALGSTDQGAVAAAQAAKSAGSGRGGSAFGGGGGIAVATRAAAGAATQQSAALASSIVQGEQARAGFKANIAGLEGNVADSLSKGRIAQAGLFESRANDEVNARKQYLDILGKLASSGISGSGGSPGDRSRSKSASQSGNASLGGGAGGGGDSSSGGPKT